MKKSSIFSSLLGYTMRHWFKLMLLGIIIIACYQKDLRFSFNLNGDKNLPTSNKQTETFTKLGTNAAAANSESSIWNLFSFGKSVSSNQKALQSIDDASKEAYLRRFAQVAVNEHKRFGIPASVILATAFVQSFAGKRDISIKSNNHFAMPCTVAWQGARSNIDDACYRSYENAWASFRDFSTTIANELPQLKQESGSDIEVWIQGIANSNVLRETNINTNDILETIKTYKLTDLDK